jgi:hypothetical protein
MTSNKTDCPSGLKKNKETDECEKIRRTRCTNGTRKNKKTGDCEDIKTKQKVKPKKTIKLDYSKNKEKDILTLLNKIPNNELLKQLESMDNKSLDAIKYDNILFPHLDDSNFNSKIIHKKEFNDLKIDEEVYDVEDRSNQLCSDKNHFELLPHQQFVKNFLSSQTPYNGLLLFHGLGTGKTCSGISIAEEMRSYLKQMGITKRIIIVASPNVQENFKSQLFNKRQLINTNGIWNLESCTGNKFLKEINPMNMKGMSKDTIEKLIKRIINKNYLFMGSEQFSNYIYRIITKEDTGSTRIELSEEQQINAIKKEFSNRLVVIDEIHNIKTVKDIPEKKTTQNIIKLVKHATNLKLLLLSATPMFNSPEEIVWLLNILNKNDNRSGLNPSDIFDTESNLIVKGTREVGKELLIQKARGYISYVRGDNPYTYPFRIYPSMFSKTNTMAQYPKPRTQMNGAQIIQGIDFLDIFVNRMEPYQSRVYNYILGENIELISKSVGGIGYHILSSPLQALNIVYPSLDYDEGKKTKYDTLIGKKGLSRIVNSTKGKTKYDYKPDIVSRYGRIFDSRHIKKYSHKIHSIIESVKQSDGIVLIYSQYIDGGCVPIALALEEAGLNRVGRDNLFTKSSSSKRMGNYSMITGDIALSPNNALEIKLATDDDNVNGDKIKVIIISEAGSEGIDLKNIRQIHIMEPWYNMNRLEQIIGRGVRTCSHKFLPFNKRNVQLFLYGTILDDETNESADMYVYRLAERKSVKIGAVSRILKENAIDCSLNKNVLTEEMFSSSKKIILGDKTTLSYKLGDKPFSSVCDYMSDCDYTCNITPMEGDSSLYTYNEYYININIDSIILKIKDLFNRGYLYDKIDIIKHINQTVIYPIVQINSALHKMVNDNSIIIFDILQRPGILINIGKFYIYQPLNMNNKTMSIFDRLHPVKYKQEKIRIVLPEKIERVNEYGETLFKTLKHKFKYRNMTTFIPKGAEDMDWYKAAGNALNAFDVPNYHKKRLRLLNVLKKNITPDLKVSLFISHMLDVLSIDNKKNLLEYLLKYSKDERVINPETILFREKLLEQFYNMMVEDSGEKFVSFASLEDSSLEYYQIVDDKLEIARPVDIKMIIKNKKKINKKIKYSTIIGLMTPFKKSYAVFKIKNTTQSRDTGYRCDQKGKIDILRVLNNTLKEGMYSTQDVFTYSNTGDIENARELCIDQELLFRYYDLTNHKNKTWFLSLENYLSTKLK